MMKKRLLLILLFVIGIAFSVCSQTLKVTKFDRDVFDPAAARLEKKDYNDDPCGLVKISFPMQNGVSFGGDVMHKYTEYKNGEWWVYMLDGSKRITIKATGYHPLSYEFNEPIRGLSTYKMIVEMPNKTNVMWYIVPGLGQIELGNKAEGYATIAGETLLLGGGVISSIAARKQLEIMRDVDVSLEDFMAAKSKYNTQKAINITCYVGAAALYGFHIYRVYHLSKKAKSKRYASLTPTIMSTDESMALGFSLNINF